MNAADLKQGDTTRDAARALLRRRGNRGSLTAWSRHCGYEPAAHHALIIRELEALERGDFDRLAVSAPPGSAKTPEKLKKVWPLP